MMSSSGDNDSYQVSRSLRFNSADSAYLSRTPSVVGNRQKWTYSVWLKRSSLETIQSIFSGRPSGNNDEWRFNASNQLEFITDSNTFTLVSTQVFRDISSWYHFVFIYNSPEATSSNRIRVYVNNVEITSWSTNAGILQNRNGNINTNTEHNIGRYVSTTENFNGYMTQIHFIDGQALTPSSFGETDANGRWAAKAYSGTYGTNGFYLNFSDNSGTTATTLGKDSSGNSNNWTPNNFSVTAGVNNDSFTDTPTNYGSDTGLGGEVRGNFATLSEVDKDVNATVSNGGLAITGVDYYFSRSTIPMYSGKWYAEGTVSGDVGGAFGIINVIKLIDNYNESSTFPNSYVILNNGAGTRVTRNNGSNTNSRTADAINDIWQIAFDADSNKLWLGRNNTWFGGGNPSTGTTPTYTVTSGIIYSIIGTGSSFNVNFGQRPFAYTAPTGFKALCTANLPIPNVKTPTQYMNAVTYTGTGSTRSLTGVGFTPDLTWIKCRNTTESHKWTDSVRGTSKSLISNTTGDEVSESGVTSFDTDGFTIGSVTSGYNTLNNTYVGWNWKKGSISGFDIVTYTGNGANRTISHALGAVPHFMIVKARTTASTDQGWAMYHRNLTSAAYYKRLDGDPAGSQTLDATVWNSTAPTSTVFSVGTSALTNTNNDTYVAYLFTEVVGFSRFGSYVGNSAADGPFVWCGFRPKYILCMNTGSTGYAIFDSIRATYNQMDNGMAAGQNAAEASAGGRGSVDFLSNGFKLRNADDTINGGSTYIFAAFAESPFKYSRGR